MSPIANDGFDGPLSYDPEVVETLKKKIEEIKAVYPVNNIEVSLAGTMDKRYQTWRKNNGNGHEK